MQVVWRSWHKYTVFEQAKAVDVYNGRKSEPYILKLFSLDIGDFKSPHRVNLEGFLVNTYEDVMLGNDLLHNLLINRLELILFHSFCSMENKLANDSLPNLLCDGCSFRVWGYRHVMIAVFNSVVHLNFIKFYRIVKNLNDLKIKKQIILKEINFFIIYHIIFRPLYFCSRNNMRKSLVFKNKLHFIFQLMDLI